MLEYVSGLMSEDAGYTCEPVVFVAENQIWDIKTIAQLREEYGVIFNGGIVAFMLIKKGDHQLVAVGYEDDGTIQFPREYGDFREKFSPFWIPSIISCLKDTQRFCNDSQDGGSVLARHMRLFR